MMEDLPGTVLLFDDDGKPFPEMKRKVRIFNYGILLSEEFE